MTARPLSLFALVLAAFFALPSAAFADDAAKEKLARELMEVTGAAQMGEQMIQALSAQMGGQQGDFMKKFAEMADGNELVELIVPIYVKTFDEETLTAAIAFYKTDAGKKLIAAMPVVQQESMMVGQKWGMELATKVQQAVEAEKAAGK